MSDVLQKFIESFLKEYIGICAISRFDAFEAAFTHSSYKNMHPDSTDYERLEILGDSLITLIITENLYLKNRSLKEISILRKSIIAGTNLSFVSKNLNFEQYIRIDRGCKISDSVLEDVYESFVGAVYLNVGYQKTKKVVDDTLYRNYLEGKLKTGVDYKTKLQEKIQSLFRGKRVIYLEESRHRNQVGKEVFVVSVSLEGQMLGKGTGDKKKTAEQHAAKEALIKLERS